jgi:hypothetical protein
MATKERPRQLVYFFPSSFVVASCNTVFLGSFINMVCTVLLRRSGRAVYLYSTAHKTQLTTIPV